MNTARASDTWLFVDGAAGFGGHEVMLLRWLSELHAQGHNKSVLLARAGSRLRAESVWCATPEDLPAASAAQPSLFSHLLQALRDTRVFLRTVRTLRPSLCIVAEGCLMSQPVYVLLARLAGIKTIVYVPLADSAEEMGFRTGRWRDLVTKYLYVGLPQAWITLTQEQARHLASWAGIAAPMFVLPNTVNRDIEVAAMQPAIGDDSGVLRVLVLGRLDAHQKGLDLLLDFLEHRYQPQPQLHITIAGDGPYGDELRQRLSQSTQLRESVTLHSWSGALGLLREHNVLLLPSRYEGVPLVMLEAMALGVAVVASRLPATTAMLPSDCLFPIGDLQEAFAILQRLHSAEARREIVKRNREQFVATASGAAFATAVHRLSGELREFSTDSVRVKPMRNLLPSTPETATSGAVNTHADVVSVVIPSRDGSETLQRALQSLVANAKYIREVIVVFSNSPAEYRQFCAELAPTYAAHFNVVLVDSGTPSNGSMARNAGINAASAPYIAFLDDDDEWLDAKLAIYLQAITDRNLSGDFVLFSSVVECNEDHSRAILFPAKPYRHQPIAEFVLSTTGGAQTSALLVPAALAKRVGFDPALPRHQDYDFCMRLEEAGAVFHAINQPLSYWYRRGSGLAKGATFEYCTTWINANRHRMSRAAYLAYLEKEVLAAVRATGRWRDYQNFLRRHLSSSERLGLYGRLGWRAIGRLRRQLFMTRAPSSAELLQLQ